MTSIPSGGYPNPPVTVIAALTTCDQNFTEMLHALDDAWATGNVSSLGTAINRMQDPGNNARALLRMAIPRSDSPGIYGPQFRLE
jgi:hypothetical protein